MTEPQQWSYFTLKMLNMKIALNSVDATLNELGADGWELVSIAALQKWAAILGNEVIFVFKKLGKGHQPPRKFLSTGDYSDDYAKVPY